VEPKLQRWVQREGWNRAAPCYERFWRRQLQPSVDRLLEMADLAPGERVVDVACGTGAVSLAAADAVGPTGRVLATDISPAMVAAVDRRAGRRGLSNVEVACAGAEQLDADADFDVGLCSLGLMYVPDPHEAVRRLARAVRPGGRVVVSVWGERRNCGWAELFPIVDRRVSSDVCPMFFALGVPGNLISVLTAAGLTDAVESRLSVDLAYKNADEALGAAFVGGPVALATSRFDAADRAAANAEYLDSISGFVHGTGYRVPGEFVVAFARRELEPHPSTSKHPTTRQGRSS
jgi:SAM-dependent methyltransferase